MCLMMLYAYRVVESWAYSKDALLLHLCSSPLIVHVLYVPISLSRESAAKAA